MDQGARIALAEAQASLAQSCTIALPNFTLKLVRPGFGPPAEPAAASLA
jgi:hypothetical protein